jgi:hypothetical protein
MCGTHWRITMCYQKPIAAMPKVPKFNTRMDSVVNTIEHDSELLALLQESHNPKQQEGFLTTHVRLRYISASSRRPPYQPIYGTIKGEVKAVKGHSLFVQLGNRFASS